MSALLLAWVIAFSDGGATELVGKQAAAYRVTPTDGALRLPAYHNNGFLQRVASREGRLEIEVVVENDRLRSSMKGRGVRGLPKPLADLERRLNEAADGLFSDQVAVLMSALRSELGYHERAGEPQDVASVLEAGEGNCVGYSNVALFVLEKMGVRARYVTGVAFRRDDKVVRKLEGSVLHRWIEIHYDDVGWVFSDPAGKANFVEATYLVLGVAGAHPLAETLDRAVGADVELLRLRDGLRPAGYRSELDSRLILRPNRHSR